MAAELPEIYLEREMARHVADGLVRQGAWRRLRRGAYIDTPEGEAWEQRRTAVQARAIIAAADPLAETAPESVVRWIAISRGMPAPVLQMPVATSRGTVDTDLAWRFQINGRLVWLHVEFDGTGKYRRDPEDVTPPGCSLTSANARVRSPIRTCARPLPPIQPVTRSDLCREIAPRRVRSRGTSPISTGVERARWARSGRSG